MEPLFDKFIHATKPPKAIKINWYENLNSLKSLRQIFQYKRKKSHKLYNVKLTARADEILSLYLCRIHYTQ